MKTFFCIVKVEVPDDSDMDAEDVQNAIQSTLPEYAHYPMPLNAEVQAFPVPAEHVDMLRPLL